MKLATIIETKEGTDSIKPSTSRKRPAAPRIADDLSGIRTSRTASQRGPSEARGTPALIKTDNHSRARKLKIVILGLSITSYRGNGHATTYRGLVRELHGRGHDVMFLERDTDWYAANRDMPDPPFGKLALYKDLRELQDKHRSTVRNADAVIVGSCVPEGISVGQWALKTAGGAVGFYDMDTPATLANLEAGNVEYISRELIAQYDFYLSFSGGPTLDRLERKYGSPMARPLYCSVDTTLYFPETLTTQYDLGYMGAYSEDRQPALDELLMEPARNWEDGKFTVVGPQYPKEIRWPANLRRRAHLPPTRHRKFYCSQKFTLNITRADMVEAGYSPSVRLFEAAACGTPVISDFWEGIDSFFVPNEEILISHSSEDTLYYLLETTPQEREALSRRARNKVLSAHTAQHRAVELEGYICDVLRPSIIRSE